MPFWNRDPERKQRLERLVRQQEYVQEPAIQERLVEREQAMRRQVDVDVDRMYPNQSPADRQRQLDQWEQVRKNAAIQRHGMDPLTGEMRKE